MKKTTFNSGDNDVFSLSMTNSNHVHIKHEYFNVYLSIPEIYQFFRYRRTIAYDGRIIQAHQDSLTIYENFQTSAKEMIRYDKYYSNGTVGVYQFNLDTHKFFKTILKMVNRSIIYPDMENRIQISIKKFGLKNENKPNLTWVQIWNNKLFTAHENLKQAIKTANSEQLSKLKEMISDKIQARFQIMNDYSDSSFYFVRVYRPGKYYNGGIIWHSNSQQFSIHT